MKMWNLAVDEAENLLKFDGYIMLYFILLKTFCL